MQDCSGGNAGVGLCGVAEEGCGGEHADAHQRAWIGDFDADLCGTQGGIEDCADVADDAGENLAGVGCETASAFWPRWTWARSFS
jgi:hypothetical protein